MKLKLTLTGAAFFLGVLLSSATGTIAQGKSTAEPKTSQERFSSDSKIRFNEKCRKSENPRSVTTSSCAQPMKSVTTGANGEIRTPAGDPHDYLYSYYMIDAWGESRNAGKHVKIYYDESDNSVYLEKFLDEYMGDCYYVAGKLIDGDLQNGTLEIETRKAVYYSWGEWLMLIIAEIDEATGSFYVDENNTTFNLNIENGVISNYTTYLALASINDDTDVYWLLSDMCYDPIDMDTAKTVEIPATAELSHYFQTANENTESIANIYVDGNDFYFNNIFEEGFTFKGTLNSANKIEVVMPQLVQGGDQFVYVNTYYPAGDSYQAGIGETIYFDYDPLTGDIEYADGAPITLFEGNKYLYFAYQEPVAQLDLIKFTEDEEPIIVPPTLTQDLYTMSTGYDEQGNHRAGLMKIARDGNTVYFLRIDNNSYDVVMMGELDPESNKVNVSLSQIVGVRNSSFLGLSLAKQSIVVVEDNYDDDYNEIRYVVDEDSPAAISLDYDPETGIYRCNEVLAVTNAQRNTVAITLIRPTFAPVSEVSEIPDGAVTNEYVFSKDGDVNNSTVVTISRSGDDFYFMHPSPNSQYGPMTVHGTLNSDGQIEIEVPQLVANGNNDQGAFLRVGKWERVYTPEDADVQMRSWGVFFDDEEVDKIYMNYDEGLNRFDYEGSFSFVQFNDNREIFKAENPYYKTYILGVYEPAAPTDLALIDKSEDYWGNGERYRLDFVIPCQDVDGKYLPYENISFRLYFDDEVFVFKAEEYPLTFTEDVTEVPFNHPASSEIPHPIWNSNMRQVYLRSLPEEKIGVQSCYTYNSVPTYSEISYLTLDSGNRSISIDQIPDKTEYFDIWGRKTNGYESGLFIVKKTYSNGSVKIEKQVKN